MLKQKKNNNLPDKTQYIIYIPYFYIIKYLCQNLTVTLKKTHHMPTQS